VITTAAPIVGFPRSQHVSVGLDRGWNRASARRFTTSSMLVAAVDMHASCAVSILGVMRGVSLLTLLGPVALRFKTLIPVIPPLVASAGGDDAPAQLQQQLLSGGAGQPVGSGV
jgi:hypothetical protein